MPALWHGPWGVALARMQQRGCALGGLRESTCPSPELGSPKENLLRVFSSQTIPKQPLMHVCLFTDVYNLFYLRQGFVCEPAA